MNQQNSNSTATKKPIKIKAQLTINRTNNNNNNNNSKLIPTTIIHRTLQPKLKPSQIITTKPLIKQQQQQQQQQQQHLPQQQQQQHLQTQHLQKQNQQHQYRSSSSSVISCCSSSSVSETTATTHSPHHNFYQSPIQRQVPETITPAKLAASHLSTDAYDNARVNRKILDLEISNASLLAINGALERTKVKQQTEIRRLKNQLTYGMNEHHEGLSEGSSSSSSQTSTLINHHGILCDLDHKNAAEQDLGELGIEDLIAQDTQFADVIKSIDSLISSATRAIHHSPPPPLPIATHIQPPPNTVLNNHTNHSLKTKVLNPIQIEEQMLRSSSHLLANP